jgi:hypothetical protein
MGRVLSGPLKSRDKNQKAPPALVKEIKPTQYIPAESIQSLSSAATADTTAAM